MAATPSMPGSSRSSSTTSGRWRAASARSWSRRPAYGAHGCLSRMQPLVNSIRLVKQDHEIHGVRIKRGDHMVRLLELLNELRVALPGVQILFAFLLTLAFTPKFGQISDFQPYETRDSIVKAVPAVPAAVPPGRAGGAGVAPPEEGDGATPARAGGSRVVEHEAPGPT